MIRLHQHQAGRLALLLASCLVLASPAQAQSCAGILAGGFNPGDGTLLFRSGNGWVLAQDGVLIPQEGARTLEFAYVVADAPDGNRAGKIIIKTGVDRVEGDPPAGAARMKLRRQHQPEMNRTQCEMAAFGATGESDISTRAYDRYHDDGYRPSKEELEILQRFHGRYVARRGACKRSDDTKTDSFVFFTRDRSNRAQFSFDPDVVAGGMHPQVAQLFRTSTARAGDLYTRREVETRRYMLAAGETTACLRFRIPVMGENQFLRVNDLEGLDPAGARAQERAWRLTR